MHGYQCPFCGAFLDPGEKCDCMEQKNAAPQTGTLESGNTLTPLEFYQESEGLSR